MSAAPLKMFKNPSKRHHGRDSLCGDDETKRMPLYDCSERVCMICNTIHTNDRSILHPLLCSAFNWKAYKTYLIQALKPSFYTLHNTPSLPFQKDNEINSYVCSSSPTP
jgi:hypothetical protein